MPYRRLIVVTLLLAVIYLAFISLGLPDSVIGSTWPSLHVDLGVPLSYAGIMGLAVAVGTVTSSFLAGFYKRRLGTGLLVAISVALTAAGIMIISFTPSFFVMLLAAVPLGLGGGAIDTALNNYVALRYKPIHMNLLHCFWGLGAFFSPMIISFFISGKGWRNGYFWVAIIQFCIAAVMFLALPLWKKAGGSAEAPSPKGERVSAREALSQRGAIAAILTFFTYCSSEIMIGLWGSTWLVTCKDFTAAAAARAVAVYYICLAAGRLASGFLSYKLSNNTLIRVGSAIALTGILSLFLPLPNELWYVSFGMIGFGFAPIYPSMIAETPKRFSNKYSQTIIGFEVGTAYIGCITIPTLFGLAFERVGTRFNLFALVATAIFVCCIISSQLCAARTKN